MSSVPIQCDARAHRSIENGSDELRRGKLLRHPRKNFDKNAATTKVRGYEREEEANVISLPQYLRKRMHIGCVFW